MGLILVKTKKEEAEKLLEVQKKAFHDDLEKYQDHESSPVNEPVERLMRKIELFLHYTILLNDEIVGGVDVRDLGEGKYRLNRIFLSPDIQGKGLGTVVMKLIESEFPDAHEWRLDTPYLNTRNHRFYEKLGYIKVGEYQVTDKLRLIDYVKKVR